MASIGKLFVSFSSKDQQDVRRLFSAFREQNIDAWDYSEDGEGLPLGQPVLESLSRKIELCEFFIAIVSAHSTTAPTGRYTEFEVQTALRCGMLERRRILPVLLIGKAPHVWAGPYSTLEPLLRIDLDSSNQQQFEDAVRGMCEFLGAPYVPPFLNDPRIFFGRRFLAETSALQLSTSDFVQLMRIMNNCAQRVLDENWHEANDLITLFLEFSGFKNPGVQLQYPLIIKGVCELQLGRSEEAHWMFTQATRLGSNADKQVVGLGHAGLGHLYFRQGRFSDAVTEFKRASGTWHN
jgi:hypothetical protein